MRRKIDIALDAEKELLYYLIDHPDEIDKLPDKSLLLPKEGVITPIKNKGVIGRFRVKNRLPFKRKM